MTLFLPLLLALAAQDPAPAEPVAAVKSPLEVERIYLTPDV